MTIDTIKAIILRRQVVAEAMRKALPKKPTEDKPLPTGAHRAPPALLSDRDRS